MDISFYPPINFSDHYSNSFEAYKRKSDEAEKVHGWIREKFGEAIIQYLECGEVHSGGGVTTPLEVLGIGSGNGIYDVEMLLKLLTKFTTIVCTVVEPSCDRINQYKELATQRKDDLAGVTFIWREEIFDEFCKYNSNNIRQFHFITAMHSLYFMPIPNIESYLIEIHGWLKNSGKLLIMHDDETGCMIQLQKHFPTETHPIRPTVHGGNILAALDSAGFPYRCSILPVLCDATECFQPNSHEGNLLLDFLVLVVGCRRNAKHGILPLIFDFIKSEEVSCVRNGKVYVKMPTQVTVISK